MVPKFDPSDLENYLLWVERICSSMRSLKSSGLRFCKQLFGKTLRVFAELSEQDCSNYDILKKTLLVAYEVCPEVVVNIFVRLLSLIKTHVLILHLNYTRYLSVVLKALRHTMMLKPYDKECFWNNSYQFYLMSRNFGLQTKSQKHYHKQLSLLILLYTSLYRKSQMFRVIRLNQLLILTFVLL